MEAGVVVCAGLIEDTPAAETWTTGYSGYLNEPVH